MKKRKYIGILAAAFALMLALAACGTDTTAASPSPSATTSTVPTVSPDSAEENSGDVTDPENSVDAGDDGNLGSMTEPEDKNSDRETGNGAGSTAEGSTAEGSAADPDENGTKPNGENSARDDLGEAGDDLADAERNAGRRMENGIRDMT
jgi:hypothetical protein